MAKRTVDFIANNSKIDFTEMKIIEIPKKKDDPYKIYNLEEILKEFDGIEGISFSISTKQEIVPEKEEF